MMQLSMGDWCMARKKKQKPVCPNCGWEGLEWKTVGCLNCGEILNKHLLALVKQRDAEKEKKK